MSRHAIIVGAGIGGLAAAIALRRAGWSVEVLERADRPRELGFALALAPNAMAALAELGVPESAIAERFDHTAAELCTESGRVLRRLERGAGPRLVVATRPALHGALLAAAGEAPIRPGLEVIGPAQAPGTGVRLRDGREMFADVVVAADGVASAMRRALHPAEPPPRPSGYVAIRGLSHDASALGDLSALLCLGRGLEAAALRAGETAVYWYASLLASDVPAEARHAPVLRDHLVRRLGPRLSALLAATRPDDLRFDELLMRDPLPSWGEGAITLLGDAAHPVLPHTGQGAAQALEDAVALGIVLSPTAPLDRRGDIPDALRRYERVRAARTDAIARLGRRIAATSTTHNWATRAMRDAAVRWLPQTALLAMFQVAGRDDPHRALRGTPAT